MPAKKDITGQVFGNLRAISCTGRKTGTSYIWTFECLLCGKVVDYKLSRVMSGACTSCGCARRARNLENIRKQPIDVKLGQIEQTNISRIKSKRIPKNNTSGCRGVSLHRQKGKSDRWIAYIYFQKTRYYLGSYTDINDAVAARKTAETQLFGDFLDWYDKNYPKR